MDKETHYFSHDYNARSDIKIKKLLRIHGMAGYGLFWAIIEDLYNNANCLPTDYDGFADDLRTTPELVKSLINDFDLFVIDKEKLFSSESVQHRLDKRMEKSQKARESVNYRWKNTNVIRDEESRNTIKKSKVKESKYIKEGKSEKKSFNQKPVKEDFNGLPENTCDMAYEFVYRTRHTKVPRETLIALWEVFKSQNLTGENFYQNEGKVYSHYLNWVKTQDFKDKPNNQRVENLPDANEVAKKYESR